MPSDPSTDSQLTLLENYIIACAQDDEQAANEIRARAVPDTASAFEFDISDRIKKFKQKITMNCFKEL